MKLVALPTGLRLLDLQTGLIGTLEGDPADLVLLPRAGPAGPPGPPGASGAGYVHTQAVAASTWTINHNLGFYPSVALYDASGFEMVADVFNVSTNIVQVAFAAAYAGSARLT